MNIKEKFKREEKKNKDKFSITIIGVIIYSVVLIMVMLGSYVGVKVILKNYENKQSLPAAQEEPKEEATPTPSPTATPTPTPEPVEETIQDEHEVELSEIFDEEKEIVDYSKELLLHLRIINHAVQQSFRIALYCSKRSFQLVRYICHKVHLHIFKLLSL